MSNEKKNDLRVWFPEDSEAIKVIQRIEELQKTNMGKALPRHLYMLKGLKEVLKDWEDRCR